MCVGGGVQSLSSVLTLCDPLDCSPPGSSVHGILQARILEWIAMEDPPLLQGVFPTQGLNSHLLSYKQCQQLLVLTYVLYVKENMKLKFSHPPHGHTCGTWPHGWVRSRIVIRHRATVRKSYSFHCIMLFLHWESQ